MNKLVKQTSKEARLAEKRKKTGKNEPQVKSVKTRLECRSGMFLAIDDQGVVHGCNDSALSSTLMFLIPVGLRVVAIQHEETGLFIAMNADGQVFTTEQYTAECKFKENVFENYWCLYSSIQYKHPETKRPWHLGIDKKGRCMKGNRAKKHSQASHFLPQPIETIMMREPVEATEGMTGDTELVRSIQGTRSNSFNHEIESLA